MLVTLPTAGRASETGMGRVTQLHVPPRAGAHQEAHRVALCRHRGPIKGSAARARHPICAKSGPMAIELTRMALLLFRLNNILGACDWQLMGDSW